MQNYKKQQEKLEKTFATNFYVLDTETGGFETNELI